MKFEIGRGFEIKGTQVNVDISQLSIEEIKDGRAEYNKVAAELGLWPPVALENQKACRPLEPPATLYYRLLTKATEGAELYIKAVDSINVNRKKEEKIPLLRPEEYEERAQDWLSQRIVNAAYHLPASRDRPCLIVPCLNRHITRAETVDAISVASDKGLRQWAGKMAFLKNWRDEHLSGFDSEVNSDDIGFYILPTAYDKAREGTIDEQNENLVKLRQFPTIQVAPVFATAILGHRYRDQSRIWQDTYTRGINLKPTYSVAESYIPFAGIDSSGHAEAEDYPVINMTDRSAARLIAK